MYQHVTARNEYTLTCNNLKQVVLECDIWYNNHATLWQEVGQMPPQLHTTDRYNMAERIQVSVSLCVVRFNVFRVFDACHLTLDYQRTEEIT